MQIGTMQITETGNSTVKLRVEACDWKYDRYSTWPSAQTRHRAGSKPSATCAQIDADSTEQTQKSLYELF